MGLIDYVRKAFGPASSAMLAVVNYVMGGDRDAPSMRADVAYLSASWAYACVHQIAQHGSSIPLQVQSAEGDVLENEIDYLLQNPNPEIDPALLMYGTLACQELYGEAYWWLVRSGPRAKVPSAIWPLSPNFVSVDVGVLGEERIKSYIWRYGEQEMHIEPRDIVHFRYWSPTSDINGHAPLEAAMLAIGADYEAALHNYQFVKHGASPSGILTASGNLTEDQKKQLKGQWRNEVEGTKNAGKVAVLSNADKFDFTQIGLSQKDAQYLEARKMNREEILGVFGVPPVVVSLYDDVNHATAGDQRRQFWADTIRPKMNLIANALTLTLEQQFGAQKGVRIVPDFSQVEALQPDYAVLIASAVQAAGGPIMTPNEARKLLLDLPELTDEELEAIKPVSPFALPPPADEEPEDDEEDGDDAEDAEKLTLPPLWRKQAKDEDEREARRKSTWEAQQAFQQPWIERMGEIVSDVYGDLAAEVIANIEADLAKGYKATEPPLDTILFSVDEAGKVLAQRLVPEEFEAYLAAGRHVIDLFNLGIDWETDNPTAQAFYAQKDLLVRTLPETYHEQIRGTIMNVLENGEPLQSAIDAIETMYQEQYGDANTPGAKRIAETEMCGAYNIASEDAYEEAGVEYHEWLHSLTAAHPRETHLAAHGEVVKIGEPFSNGLMYPHAPDAPPEETINCGCTTAPIIDPDEKPETPPVPEGYGDTGGRS